MPIVSQFYGVIIRMYYDDMKHHNMPHLHIQYNDYKAIYDLNGKCTKGMVCYGKLYRTKSNISKAIR